MDRRAQLRELFHVDFPEELFAVWEWTQRLEGETARAFHDVLGISLNGPFDVLAGTFDDHELVYPAVLHWRYQYDPPELFTVMTGNTDGLHWGYWFDDPGRLPPVVASFYARDAFELVEAPSLWRAIATHLAATRRGTLENRESDPKYAASYDRDLAALDALLVTLPPIPETPKRVQTVRTGEGMGIVVQADQVAAWNLPKEVVREDILAFVESELAAGRPGTALLVGRKLWDGHKALAFEVLDRAYAGLGRETLRAVAKIHRAHPALPKLDILAYKRGDYGELATAFANPSDVRKLEVHRLASLPDEIGELANLEVLQLGGGQLTALPASLARCTKLREINLYNNKLAQLPPVLLELPALRELTLGKNQLTSVEGIGRLRQLEELDLAMNPITTLPADFLELTKLTSLNLAGTKLPALPERFCDLEQLVYLALQNTPIVQLPADLARLSKLKRLALPKLHPDDVARVRAALPATEVV